MWETIQQIFPYAIAFTIPLLITALGALFSERSGVVNIGLGGLMIVGSFSGAFTVSKLQEAMPGSSLPLWIGLGVAVLVGILFSLFKCRSGNKWYSYKYDSWSFNCILS